MNKIKDIINDSKEKHVKRVFAQFFHIFPTQIFSVRYMAREKLCGKVQVDHLELRKTDCLLQGFIFDYMGLTMRQKFCIFWTF
jgi:hypothetical protein